MYYGMLHTHTLFVVLYILFFLSKLILLMMGKVDTLANYRKKTKILEMILPTGFLLTGLYLAFNSPYVGESWFIGKIILLVLAIILGVITFKKNNIALGVITLFIFVYLFGISETKTLRMVNRLSKTIGDPAPETNAQYIPGATSYDRIAHGAYLFKTKDCVACHGEKGDKRYAGAGDLRVSQLNEEEITTVIRLGRKTMPAYRKYLDDQEIKALTEYVRSLRQQ